MDDAGRKRRVLRTLVDVTDENGRPVSVLLIAESMECDPEVVRGVLDSLRAYEFVGSPADGRYEPTVTGREFLALDIDAESFVVVDTSGDHS